MSISITQNGISSYEFSIRVEKFLLVVIFRVFLFLLVSNNNFFGLKFSVVYDIFLDCFSKINVIQITQKSNARFVLFQNPFLLFE